MNTIKKLWLGLAILIVLTPLGLLARGTAWGEWGSEELQQMLGYVPEGIAKGEMLYSAVFSGYALPGLGDSFIHSAIGYVFSAAVGIGIIVLVMYGLGRILLGNEQEENGEQSDERNT